MKMSVYEEVDGLVGASLGGPYQTMRRVDPREKRLTAPQLLQVLESPEAELPHLGQEPCIFAARVG